MIKNHSQYQPVLMGDNVFPLKIQTRELVTGVNGQNPDRRFYFNSQNIVVPGAGFPTIQSVGDFVPAQNYRITKINAQSILQVAAAGFQWVMQPTYVAIWEQVDNQPIITSFNGTLTQILNANPWSAWVTNSVASFAKLFGPDSGDQEVILFLKQGITYRMEVSARMNATTAATDQMTLFLQMIGENI